MDSLISRGQPKRESEKDELRIVGEVGGGEGVEMPLIRSPPISQLDLNWARANIAAARETRPTFGESRGARSHPAETLKMPVMGEGAERGIGGGLAGGGSGQEGRAARIGQEDFGPCVRGLRTRY
jgi:hypothetical protein